MSDTNDFIVWANSAVTEANESRPLSEILLPNEKGFLLLCRCDAERVSARAEALEDRAALAEARLEALNNAAYVSLDNTLRIAANTPPKVLTFDLRDVADALRARGIGPAKELPERKERT